MTETKTIRVNVCIPVDVDLRVTWDEDERAAKVHDVQISHGQSLSPRSLYENLDEDMLQYIDDKARAAWGIEGE